MDGKAGSHAEVFERVSHNIKLKHYSEALDDLNTVIKTDPMLSKAYSQRASILRQLCRYTESEKNYKKFLELKPGNSAAEKELSQLYQAQSALDKAYELYNSGDFTKSMDYIDKFVIVFSPACSKAKFLKVKLLLATKDYSGAIFEYGFILKEDENNIDTLLLRGRAYYYLGDHDVALRHYRKGLRLDPEHSELKKAYFGLKNLVKKTKSAEDNADKGKLRVAIEDFKAALALDPNHAAHNVNLYLGLCKIGVTFDDIGALEDVKKALYELVIFPIKRPKFFSHGNFLQPCSLELVIFPDYVFRSLRTRIILSSGECQDWEYGQTVNRVKGLKSISGQLVKDWRLISDSSS